MATVCGSLDQILLLSRLEEKQRRCKRVKTTKSSADSADMVNRRDAGSASLPPARPPYGRSRCLALPLMALAFGMYALLHSPLQRPIAKLFGHDSRACYFVCAIASLNSPTLLESIAAWLLIATALLAAEVITRGFDGAAFERPLSFGLSALAFLVVPAAAIGGIAAWTHTALLRPPLGPLLAMLPAVGVVAIALRRGWRPYWPHLAFRPSSPLISLIGGLAVTLFVASMAISLMHPPTGGDGLSYHAPLAIFFWRDGNLITFLNRAPGTWALANPGTAELWYGLLKIAGGEHLANFGQLPFALLGSAA